MRARIRWAAPECRVFATTEAATPAPRPLRTACRLWSTAARNAADRGCERHESLAEAPRYRDQSYPMHPRIPRFPSSHITTDHHRRIVQSDTDLSVKQSADHRVSQQPTRVGEDQMVAVTDEKAVLDHGLGPTLFGVV